MPTPPPFVPPVPSGRDEDPLAAAASELLPPGAAERVLEEIESLPTLPTVASRLMQAASSDDVPVAEIVRLIESDPTLTARLLSLCRRAGTGLGNRITTVSHAVVMLGLDAVRSMVLSVQVMDWDRRADESRRARAGRVAPPGMDRVGFWQHCIAVACCCELIAREHPRRVQGHRPDEVFVAGLLHDVGKLALELVLPRAYARVVRLAEEKQADIARFERLVLGIDHHEAGRRLAEKWNLPAVLRDVIAGHGEIVRPDEAGIEEPAEAEKEAAAGRVLALTSLRGDTPPAEAGRSSEPVVRLVALSDAVCRRLHLGWSGNHSTRPTIERLAARLAVPTATVESIYPRIYESTSERQRDLGLCEEPCDRLFIESILKANARLGRLNARLALANADLAEAQQRLAEKSAMARLGEMAAGAAHEMNNPLTVISGRSQSLLRSVDTPADRAAARAIVDASARLSDLITRLHLIARPPEPRFGPVNVVDLLSDVVKEARRRTMRGRGGREAVMPIRVLVGGNIPPARMDRELMARALVEVMVNAVEARPRTGIEVRVQTDRADGRLMIQVSDDGAGMSPHVLRHALDPFFSSKPAGRQPGLGLATAQRLIELHSGEIDLDSREQHGTVATVRLREWRWTGPAGAVGEGGVATDRIAA